MPLSPGGPEEPGVPYEDTHTHTHTHRERERLGRPTARPHLKRVGIHFYPCLKASRTDEQGLRRRARHGSTARRIFEAHFEPIWPVCQNSETTGGNGRTDGDGRGGRVVKECF